MAIELRRGSERRTLLGDGVHAWQTFDSQSNGVGFGSLVALDELHFSPGGGAIVPSWAEGEIVTVVHRGALRQADSMGRSAVLYAGEVQRRSSNDGLWCREENASQNNVTLVFRTALLSPEANRETAYEQTRFTAAERHNRLCAVGSVDGRRGSLRLRGNALVLAGVLDAGRHLLYDIPPDSAVWLHVMTGEMRLREFVLSSGDGAGLTDERAVALTATRHAELLLVQLPMSG